MIFCISLGQIELLFVACGFIIMIVNDLIVHEYVLDT